MVCLADLVAGRLGHGLDEVEPEEATVLAALEPLGLDEEKLLFRASLRFEQILERFG